jgi:hypothetical protein
VHRISPSSQPPAGPKNPQDFLDKDKFDGTAKPAAEKK